MKAKSETNRPLSCTGMTVAEAGFVSISGNQAG